MIKLLYRFLSPKFQNVFLEYKVDFKPRFGHGKGEAHPQLYKIVNSFREDYKQHLKTFLTYKEVFHSIKTSDTETQENLPTWNN